MFVDRIKVELAAATAATASQVFEKNMSPRGAPTVGTVGEAVVLFLKRRWVDSLAGLSHRKQ